MFKKLIQATVAAAIVATPMVASVAEAQQQTHRTTTVQHRPNGTTVRKTVVNRAPARVAPRRWAKGQRFDRRYATNYAVVDYRRYKARRLYAPPRGYHWVRSGNDAVLVGVTTGLIAATLAGALQ
jgi:Ni/Co efflux regulator RcnB